MREEAEKTRCVSSRGQYRLHGDGAAGGVMLLDPMHPTRIGVIYKDPELCASVSIQRAKFASMGIIVAIEQIFLYCFSAPNAVVKTN